MYNTQKHNGFFQCECLNLTLTLVTTRVCIWITLYDPVWVEDEWHFSDIITSE